MLMHGGQVDINKCLESYGKGRKAPTQSFDIDAISEARRLAGTQPNFTGLDRWSTNFQWLPCEVEFVGGLASTDVRITSYINNLHPVNHRSLYNTIEKLISLAVTPWNETLILRHHGRAPRRIRTYGAVGVKPPYPANKTIAADNFRLLEKDKNTLEYAEALQWTKDYMALPEPGELRSRRWVDIPDDWEIRHKQGKNPNFGLRPLIYGKWQRVHHVVHPEPGVSFTYTDWREGRTSKAIIAKTNHFDPEGDIDLDPDHQYYTVSLRESFAHQGLQVIVKIAGMELETDNPSYPGTEWAAHSQGNERIAATATYYYDVSNVSDNIGLSFRQNTWFSPIDHHWEEGSSDDLDNLAETFGVESGELEGEATCQELGFVPTPQGRFLVFPNVLQSRIEPFELHDKTRAGHVRFITLWLVDPYQRICSTRNVPPQRHDWWAQEAIKKLDTASDGRLPAEIKDMIDAATDDWPMGIEEAKQLRLKLLAEHKRAREVDEAFRRKYVFYDM